MGCALTFNYSLLSTHYSLIESFPFSAFRFQLSQLLLLQTLRILGNDKVVDAVLNIAIHKRRQVVDRVVYAVVGDSTLRIVVGANLCRTVASRYECLTLRRNLVEVLLIFEVEDTGTQLLKRLLGILNLRLLVLTLHHNTCRDVGESDGRVGGIHRLTARTRCTEYILANIVPRNLAVELVSLR